MEEIDWFVGILFLLDEKLTVFFSFNCDGAEFLWFHGFISSDINFLRAISCLKRRKPSKGSFLVILSKPTSIESFHSTISAIHQFLDRPWKSNSNKFFDISSQDLDGRRFCIKVEIQTILTNKISKEIDELWMSFEIYLKLSDAVDIEKCFTATWWNLGLYLIFFLLWLMFGVFHWKFSRFLS